MDGVPAQRQDPAARAADVAEQHLQDRRGADVLHADGVLRPADAVDERRGPVPAGVLGDQLADLLEDVLRDAADPLHHLRRVAREVPLEHLEDAARVLQRLVASAGCAARGRAAGAVRLAACRPRATWASRSSSYCRVALAGRGLPPRIPRTARSSGRRRSCSRSRPEKSAVEVLGVAEVLATGSSAALV